MVFRFLNDRDSVITDMGYPLIYTSGIISSSQKKDDKDNCVDRYTDFNGYSDTDDFQFFKEGIYQCKFVKNSTTSIFANDDVASAILFMSNDLYGSMKGIISQADDYDGIINAIKFSGYKKFPPLDDEPYSQFYQRLILIPLEKKFITLITLLNSMIK